jgi:CheY-like chemotaxis protein
MQTLFETWGAIVICGETIESLIAAIGDLERYPDLIVADLRLAGNRCGVEAIARLRDEFGAPIPALIVSGDTGLPAAQRVRRAGLPLLAKPVDPAALENAACELIVRG